MYVHLGGNVVIPGSDIIAIIDINFKEIPDDTLQFLKISDEEGFIVNISEEKPKSFIITEKNKKSVIYLSPVSSYTISKRMRKQIN
ncbi:DUF370 domain-containing protein [Aceticella autotrophica]|uniref:DUF370 domain-containing protein n=1 Tax=Aceticella autotrophica TaxID=2755338 RepID=A0A975AVT5_9THEO|nr:extracellular matrix/biofilm biosynthesis regulator RemA family protein [Aceticella autotrophica]QSZ27374.1 DUF370 domain-containing protein [Aceticella autotrophica]